jgi:rhodanese-related sulfurtransferase
MLQKLARSAAFVTLWAVPAGAEGLSITPDLADLSVTIKGETLSIARLGVDGELQCPPHCVQPMQAAPGGQTLGALEVIGFLRAKVATDQGRILDVRLPAEFATTHLPGAINVPLATLVAENPYRDDILQALGATKTAEGLDFAAAPLLLIYASGPGNDLAAIAVRTLVEGGYPIDKVLFFRGGLQEWQDFGLTVSGAADQG